MFTTQRINLFDFFYPIGSTPAVSLTQSLPSKVSARILLLGCGDLRNILFTTHLDCEFQTVLRRVSEVPSLTENLDRPLDITSCDAQKAVIARNILLLTLIIDDIDAKDDTSIWNIYYHMRIDKKSDDLLKTQAWKLVGLSASLETWKQSKYGSQLKFCDIATLADVRTMWLFYSSSRTKADNSAIKMRLDSMVNENMKCFQGSGVLDGLRAAAPAHLLAYPDMEELHKRFWTQGALDHTTGASSKNMLPNRMFLPDDGISTLHYALNPLLGFHVATAYVPLEPQSPSQVPGKGSDQLHKIFETARQEFMQWAASFRRHAAFITLRFFIGDAVAFAYTLRHARASGSPTAGFYRNRHQFKPLTLIESDYGASVSAPLTFDVVDTSNLGDHIGGLNLLIAVSPLLANNLASTVYTEVKVDSINVGKEALDKMLCGDTPTVSTFLALFPAEYWTNASCISWEDENFLRVHEEHRLYGSSRYSSARPQKTHEFLRVAWKRPPGPASSGDTDVSLVRIQFTEENLAHLLYRIYVRMFDDEEEAETSASLRTDPSTALESLNSQPQYHFASLTAFLLLVKRRVSCYWDKTMGLFRDLVKERPKAMHRFQELFAYLHVLDVTTVVINEDPNLILEPNTCAAGINDLRAWKRIPSVICVTLKVPRACLKAFSEGDRLSLRIPTVHCKITDGSGGEVQFAACQFSFGEVSTRGTRHSDGYEVCVNEDKTGWNGISALIVMFYTPSWFMLPDYSSFMVSFELHVTVFTLRRFMKHYGPNLKIYETAINNIDNVYLTKYAPHQRVYPKVQGFTRDQISAPYDILSKTTQKLNAIGDPQTGALATVVGQLFINSERHRAALADGATVTIASPTPCHSTVNVGEEQPLDLFFPVPVLESKVDTFVFRYSEPCYIVVVIAQVATAARNADFPISFVYPLCLSGSKKAPLAWTMSHLDLQKQPALNLLGEVNSKGWLSSHIAAQMSSRERALRADKSLLRTPGENVRLNFKESLLAIFVSFSGLQGPKASIFGISNPEKGGINMLILPNKLRIDLATRTLVLDCAILPLHKYLAPKVVGFLGAITSYVNGEVITVDEAQMRMWQQVLPAWVERCRTDWIHRDDCEYRAAGEIPLPNRHEDDCFLCSCGQGVFPSDFALPDVPEWLSMARQYCTRAAISPVFSTPFAHEMYIPLRDEAETQTPSGCCNVCGAKQKKDGGKLMRCGRCLLVEYCSVECQKKNWKEHKKFCYSSKA